MAPSGCCESQCCRCFRQFLNRLLAPITNAFVMLIISLVAIVSVGDMLSRLENHGARGVNDTLQYAAALLDTGNETDSQMENLLRAWSSKLLWSPEEGIYYTFSLFSTIGFGRYSPATSVGRAISVLFIVLLVPIGVLYVQCLSSVYQSMLCRLLTANRHRFSNSPRITKLIFPSGDETIIVIPVTVITVLFHLHLLVALPFVCLLESWSPIQTIYYFISATTTIGFGDYHTGPHSLSFVLALATFHMHMCSIYMLIINYLNDILEWALQSYFSHLKSSMLAAENEIDGWRPSDIT